MLGGFQWVFNNVILQWTEYYNTQSGMLLPIAFSQVYRWACRFGYYNSYITDVVVHNTKITHNGGPSVQVPIHVIAIGI